MVIDGLADLIRIRGTWAKTELVPRAVDETLWQIVGLALRERKSISYQQVHFVRPKSIVLLGDRM